MSFRAAAGVDFYLVDACFSGVGVDAEAVPKASPALVGGLPAGTVPVSALTDGIGAIAWVPGSGVDWVSSSTVSRDFFRFFFVAIPQHAGDGSGSSAWTGNGDKVQTSSATDTNPTLIASLPVPAGR